MARIIKMGTEEINEAVADFKDMLLNHKMSDGKLNFSRSFGKIERKATVYFTEMAYLKMMLLVDKCSKEIGWHGIAKRGDNPDLDEYIISDILVYPQEVAAATVTTDQEKYQMWLMNQPDEIFNNIRMQGHSHVNMSTTPSAVDEALYESILGQLEDDMFYIFLIWNKKGDKTIKIYDMAKNILFETDDVDVDIIEDGTGIAEFLDNAKTMVKERKYTSVGTTNNFGNKNKGTESYVGYPYYGNAQKKKKKKEVGYDAYQDYAGYYGGYGAY